MVFSLFMSLLLACTSGDKAGSNIEDSRGSAPEDAPGDTLEGGEDWEQAPSDADLATLGEIDASFSLELMRRIHGMESGNFVVSPWSLQLVMAQVYAGADGDAKRAIGDTFGWTLSEPELHVAFDAAALEIGGHDAPTADPPLVLTSTHQIFVADGYSIGEDWLNTLSKYYGTSVQQMDFEGDPSGVAEEINAWIAARTGDHIKDLISPSMVASSRLLLANALYFSASWGVPFIESLTEDRDFTLLDGSVVSAATMSGSIHYDGGAGDGCFVLDIPYSDEGLSMTLVVPEAGRFEEVASSLSWADLAAILDSAEACRECEVSLPKFTIESRPPVQEALVAMGMDAAFGGAYSGINADLTLTGVEQAGFLAVNEIGTEAAAATVAEFSDTGSVSPFGPIDVNRPFLYLIRDRDTNQVLFGGMVLDPR